ncbi:apelin receptor B-like [Festucalex cinctus]
MWRDTWVDVERHLTRLKVGVENEASFRSVGGFTTQRLVQEQADHTSSNTLHHEPEKENRPTESPHEYHGYEEMENTTNCDYSNKSTSLVLITVFYIIIFILGLFGNSMVIFTVWRAQEKRRASHVYIGNLALADLAFIVMLPLWAVEQASDMHWPFGVALCKISNYVMILNMYASVFLLTCMSFDRCLAIVRSLSRSQLYIRSHMRASLAAIWTLSGLLSVPAFVFNTTRQPPSSNQTFCFMDFSLVASSRQQGRLWSAGLSLMLSALGFLVPFLVMMVCYGLISCTVTHHFNTRCKEHQRKRRLLKIIATVVVVFSICWIPFHVLNSADALSELYLFQATCTFHRFLVLAHPYTACLAYINSCLNPFLYAFLDLRFRSQCLSLLHLKKSCQTPIKF